MKDMLDGYDQWYILWNFFIENNSFLLKEFDFFQFTFLLKVNFFRSPMVYSYVRTQVKCMRLHSPILLILFYSFSYLSYFSSTLVIEPIGICMYSSFAPIIDTFIDLNGNSDEWSLSKRLHLLFLPFRSAHNIFIRLLRWMSSKMHGVRRRRASFSLCRNWAFTWAISSHFTFI